MERLESRRLLAAQISLNLINSATDKVLFSLVDGSKIDKSVVGSRLNVAAVPSQSVGSVKFQLDGAVVRTESGAPYALASDNGGNYYDWNPAVGTHTLVATAYSKASAGGIVLGSSRVQFSVVTSPPPVSPPPVSPPPASPPPVTLPASGPIANLYDTSTDQLIGQLSDGQTLDLSTLGSHLSVVAVPQGKAGSMMFLWDGAVQRIESAAPYSINGDSGLTNLTDWLPASGQHTLEMRQYSLSGAAGTLQASATLELNVVGEPTSPPPLSPPPVSPPPVSPPPVSPPPISPPPGPVSDNPPPPGTANNPGAPAPVVQVIGQTGVAGHPVIVDATQSSLPNSALFAHYQWDFGDPDGRYNSLPGWTAGHVYDTPGTYDLSLTITDGNGSSASTHTTITVLPDTRRTIYVDSVSGNDSNPGTIGAPIKSFTKATSLVANDTEILFHRGQSWNTNYWMTINKSNVTVGAYGSGANPVLNVVSNKTAIQTFSAANHVVIEDITFDSPYKPSGNIANKVGVNGIFVDGTDIAIRNCTFLNVDDGVNMNQEPNGVILQDNDAPSATGVRGYMMWTEGTDIVILGNTAANSTREHNIRVSDGSRLLIAYNNLTNLSRQSVDASDGKKGTIQMQRGSWAYIYGNSTKDGPLRVGPRGEDTEPASTRTPWVVVENNKITNYQLDVYPGTQHLMIRDNTFYEDAQSCIALNPQDAQGRGMQDVYILDNIGHNNASTGRFLRVNGGVQNDTVTLGRNHYIAPNLGVGVDGTFGVSVSASNLDGFRQIFNNVWPVPKSIIKYAQGGVMWVYPNYTGQTGYKDPQEWLAYPEVTGDVFTNG